MHYYQFNIADYRKDTQHLSPIEHYIYRELMDWYYLDETPIPKITKLVLRKLRLTETQKPELENVLEEFFSDTEEGWKHGRIDVEIGKYHDKVDTAKANGSKGGRPRKHPEEKPKTKRVNSDNPEITGSKANHKPITKNQLKEKDKKEIADRVIGFLNQNAQTRYRLTETNRDLVIARLNDGYTEKDCFYVITNRCQRWLGTEQEQYIRPDTIFRPKKFESYLNDKGVNHAQIRSGGNPAQNQRKPTPAERTAAKREAVRQRELTQQSPVVGVVGAHGGNVRPHLGITTG